MGETGFTIREIRSITLHGLSGDNRELTIEIDTLGHSPELTLERSIDGNSVDIHTDINSMEIQLSVPIEEDEADELELGELNSFLEKFALVKE